MRLKICFFRSVCVSLLLGLLPHVPLAAQKPPEKGSERRTYHILLGSKSEAVEVRKEIVTKGSTLDAFKEVARTRSRDVATKRTGGDLGWVGRSGTFTEAFVYAVWMRKIGRVSRPIPTRNGWHLIVVTKQRGGEPEGELEKPQPVQPPERSDQQSDRKAIWTVERYIQATGGRDAYAAIRDRTAKFLNTKHEATGETAAKIALFVKRGLKFREEWEIEGFKVEGKQLSFIQTYNGKKGWVKMFGTVSPLEGRTLGVFVWDKFIDDFFLHWKKDGYKLEHDGPGRVDAKPVEKITVVDYSGRQTIRYSFSTDTGLLVKKEWNEMSKDNKPQKKEQYYRKYTPISFSDDSDLQIKVPMLLKIHVNGELDTTRTYNEASFNTGLADDFFDKPPGKDFNPGASDRTTL